MPRVVVDVLSDLQVELSDPQIERLVLQYTREMARYEKAAEIVANKLRRELRAEARLRHLISFRAKHPDDLREKLRRKATDPKYANYDDLRENLNAIVTDLAGCRVVVYVPEDELRVVDLIDRVFQFPDRKDAKPDRNAKPTGYLATHRLVVASDNPDDVSIRDAICEIQITTLAAHLFNELEHDITYKQHDGQCASVSERRILKQILHLTRVSDHLVDDLMLAHRQTTTNHGVLRDPESLRFALEHEAGRPLAGDFVRLYRMLEGVVDPLNMVTLGSLGKVTNVLDIGKTRAVELGLPMETTDDVMYYVLGLPQYQEDFIKQATSWRGPETNLKRALFIVRDAFETTSFSRMIDGQEGPNV
jgi:ppGpp synthetase/RelA/SpoT-type nucleotidyltranferase